MRCKKSGLDLLQKRHQRACHEFWLARTRGFSLSEDTQNFVKEHPEFIFEQFDHEFDEDPFQRQLGNPRNFFCPDSRHSPLPTPPYSGSSDEESEREVDSNSPTIPPKKISKAGSKVKSQSSSALRTKTNSSVRSVTDCILKSYGDPIHFHKSRSIL
jgi:hypothetical protein